ncbi:MAG: ribonuclease III [Acidimicrobiia bacterium]
MTALEERLGHRFARPDLLALALTHRSVSSDDPTRADNERLEFLGDAVLQLVVTDLLYHDYPDLAEGKLAKARASVVARPLLADIARRLDLGPHLELAPAEERTGGRAKDSILADALEAVIGALFLDGGLEVARRIVETLFGEQMAERAKRPGVRDYKTRLQEILAQTGQRPLYQVVGEGPDHDRKFAAVVSVEDRALGSGEGRSKKEAEQAAAREAIEALSEGLR